MKYERLTNSKFIKDKINISRYKKLYRQKTFLIVKIKIVIDNYDNICYCNAV